MGVQAGVTKEGSSLFFTGSTSNENPGFGTTGGPLGGPPGIYDLKWDHKQAAIMVKRTAGDEWQVLIPFEAFDYLETP